MTRKRNAFSYAIDYDKAIAEDEREIEKFSTIIELGLYNKYPKGYVCGVQEYLFSGSEINYELAARLGLDRETVLALLYLEQDDDRYAHHAEVPSSPGLYVKGRNAEKALFDRFWWLPTEEEAKVGLKRAKQALSRHRRNKAKYGK